MAAPTPIPHASPSHNAAALRSNSSAASTSPIAVNAGARSPPSPPLVSPLLSRSPFASLSGGASRGAGAVTTTGFAPPASSSSYSSSSNGDDREPTTPRTADFSTSPFSSGSAGMGAPLGRVPSFPLSGSYDGVALGRGWASQGSTMGFAARSPPAEKEHKAMGLLRRFSMGAGSSSGVAAAPTTSAAPPARSAALAANVGQQAPVNARHSRSFSAASTSSTSSDAVVVSSPSPAIAVPVSPDASAAEPRKMRGRQGSLSGSTKRRPSPMGERLLMGHFNAH